MVQCSLRLAVGEARTTWRHSSVGQSIRFIPEVSPVRIQVPLPKARDAKASRVLYGPLVKWLRHGPFTAVTWVRVPYGSPLRQSVRGCRINGGLAQLVRAPASHAGGHWFESSSLHQNLTSSEVRFFLFSAKGKTSCLSRKKTKRGNGKTVPSFFIR